MSGWRGCEKLRKKKTSNAQRPTPNIQFKRPTSKLNLKSSFHRKRRSWHRNAITRGEKKIGKEATNCASEFSRSVGKCATQKTARNLRAAQQSDFENSRSQQRTRFAMLSAENVCACRFSRPRTYGPPKVIRKPESCLGRA